MCKKIYIFLKSIENKDNIYDLVLLFVFIRILDHDICDKYLIDKKYLFENLKLLNKTELYFEIFLSDYFTNVLDKLKINFNYVVTINHDTLFDVFKVLDNIDDISSLKNLDSYYFLCNTNKNELELNKFLLNKLNPNVNESIYDPYFGWTTTIKDYMKYSNINDIFCVQFISDKMNCKYKLNYNLLLFIILGKNNFNIKYKDSLRQLDDIKYDNIFIRPMYGCNFIKCENFSRKIKTELLFLHHLTHKLSAKGKSMIVLPFDFLEDESIPTKETIEFIILNYNLENIYFYDNKVIFNINNLGKTTHIHYHQLINNNNDINDVYLHTINLFDLIKQNYTLKINPFFNIKFKNNIKYEKLSNFFDIKHIKAIKLELNGISHLKNNNNYKIIGSNFNNKFYKECNCSKNMILLNLFSGKITLTEDNVLFNKQGYVVFKPLTTKISSIFLYHYLLYNNGFLLNLARSNGNCISYFNQIKINNLKDIPIPILENNQFNNIINSIHHYNNKINILEEKIKEIEELKKYIK